MKITLLLACVAFALVVGGCDKTQSENTPGQSASIWVMQNDANPKLEVKFWLSQRGDHADCEAQSYSKALALAEFLVRMRNNDEHEIHDHLIRHPDGGYAILEHKVLEDKEIPLYDFSKMHYHGIYVDIESAAEMFGVLLRHQHLTKKEMLGKEN